MKKVEFLKVFDECIARKDVNFIAVAVEGVAEKEELIINPRINFETKRAYYEKTYNDDMRLVIVDTIGIVWISGIGDLNLYAGNLYAGGESE